MTPYLTAIRGKGGEWEYRIKLSEQTIKVSNPGILNVRRFRNEHEFLGDAIWSETLPVDGATTIVDPLDMTRRKVLPADVAREDLLVPIFRSGKLVYQSPSITHMRKRTGDQLAMFHPGVKRPLNPHTYPVGLEKRLHDLKTDLIMKARGL